MQPLPKYPVTRLGRGKNQFCNEKTNFTIKKNSPIKKNPLMLNEPIQQCTSKQRKCQKKVWNNEVPPLIRLVYVCFYKIYSIVPDQSMFPAVNWKIHPRCAISFPSFFPYFLYYLKKHWHCVQWNRGWQGTPYNKSAFKYVHVQWI